MQAYSQLEKIFEKIYHLQHLRAITSWDEAVMMPVGGGPIRARALATLRGVSHKTITDPRVKTWLAQAKQEDLVDPWQVRNLQLMEKKYLQETCVPADLVQRLTESSILSEQAWRQMRAENNWQDFLPHLEKTFSLVKEVAHIRSQTFNQSVYDVLIDEYSPDLTQAAIEPIFSQLKTTLPSLIKEIIHKQKSTHTISLTGYFHIEKQRHLGLELMKVIGFDFNHGRLDVSHHPFCGGSARDVRMTTRYVEDNFLNSAMSVCHETGHACYEQGLPLAWIEQPVGDNLGMAVHESQSLLIEMQACRSLEFMQFLAGAVKNFFGDHADYNAENLHHLTTRVKPSLIRVDADEVTYPLHIILRYELEKALFAGDLQVADLPAAWDEGMQKYLGLSTKNNYRDGIMQDVHWPSGSFGYFPAYSIGRLMAAQFFKAAHQAHPEILPEIAQGNFTPLLTWLNKNVYSKGSLLTYDKLLKESTGEELTITPFIDTIKKRYL